MRVSKAKKAETKRKIIQSAVHLITIKSFEKASLREIAQDAGIGEATIYNYFSNKDKILYAYFAHALESAINDVKSIPDFPEFSLQEKFHALVETQLQGFLPDREFVGIAHKRLFKTAIASIDEVQDMRKKLISFVDEIVQDALDNDEIDDASCKKWCGHAVADYYLIVLSYWLQDSSDRFNKTSEFIDLSLPILMVGIESGVAGKVMDLGAFLLKSHLFRFMKYGGKFDKLRKNLKNVMLDD